MPSTMTKLVCLAYALTAFTGVIAIPLNTGAISVDISPANLSPVISRLFGRQDEDTCSKTTCTSSGQRSKALLAPRAETTITDPDPNNMDTFMPEQIAYAKNLDYVPDICADFGSMVAYFEKDSLSAGLEGLSGSFHTVSLFPTYSN
jgi:hypothetical protein